ncbi:MAG: transcriptional activator NhaR [Polyangiaceae bacterium]|jgi:LysR family transcriptional activator of nhaA|nr:transcriptional activator NhaR [Polyangiaceae bacterium]
MEWLNYHHLLYFWTVAREGGLAPAAKKLRLSPPTVSAQVNALERAMGEELFEKQGRRLVLTEVGKTVYRYADEIFALGRELVEAVKHRPAARPLRLAVGIVDAVPKLIARRMLAAALELTPPAVVVCREDHADRLIADLALHDLDVVLSDAPAPPSPSVKVFSHLLGQSDVGLYAAESLVTRYKAGFPRSLDGAPMLMPAGSTTLRRALDAWLDDVGVRPTIVGEFDDSALIKAFAYEGLGIFAAPVVLQREIRRQYGVRRVGACKGVRERYYAISAERKLTHPAVLAISRRAKDEMSLRAASRG